MAMENGKSLFVGNTSSNGPFSIAMLVHWSATAKKPPKSDLAKVFFFVRETFGKTTTCQVARAVSEKISRFHSSRTSFQHPEKDISSHTL